MATPFESFLKSPGARRYYRQMKAGLDTTRPAQPSGGIDSGLQDYIREGNRRQAPAPSAVDPIHDIPNKALKALDVLLQPGYAVTELVQRGTAGAIKGLTNEVKSGNKNLLSAYARSGDDILREVIQGGNPFGTGNSKFAPSDMLRGSERFRQNQAERGLKVAEGPGDQGPLATGPDSPVGERGLKAIAGFGADVLLDPMTYVTGGAVGSVIKGAGAGIKGAAEAGSKLARAGEITEKVGAGIVKADDAVNRAITDTVLHPIKTGRAVAEGARSVASKLKPKTPVEAVTQAAREVTEDAAKKAVIAETAQAVADEGLPQSALDFISGLKDSEGAVPNVKVRGQEKRGLLPADRLIPDESVIPYSGRKASQTLRDVTDESAIAHLRTGAKDTYISPFTVEKVARTNTPSVESVAAQAPEVRTAELIEQATKPYSSKPTADEIKEWVKANPKETITYRNSAGQDVTVEISRALAGLAKDSLTPFPASVRQNVTKALAQRGGRGVLTDRAAMVADAAAEGSGRPSPGLAPAPRVTGAGRGSSPVEAAQDASDAASGRSVVQRPSNEIYNIKRRYRRALSDRAYDHLWDDGYLKDPALTPAQKQREWEKRIRDIRKGLATEEPAYYEVFYARQFWVEFGKSRPAPGTTSRVSYAAAKPGSPSATLNAELATTPTAPAIVDATDTSIEAATGRIAAADRILRGENLSEVEWNALRSVSGNKELGKAGVTGQQWAGRAAEFDKTTSRQGTARNASRIGEGQGVNIESYNSKAQMNLFRDILRQHSEAYQVSQRVAGGPDMWKRARDLRASVTDSVVKAETFLRAHGVEPIMGTMKSGVPFSLGDMLTAMGSTRKGRQFLEAHVFGGQWGLRVKGYGAQGTVYVDDLMRVFESIVDKLDGEAIQAAQEGVDVLAAIGKTVAETAKGKINRQTLEEVLTSKGQSPITTVKPTRGGGQTALEQGGFPVDVDNAGTAVSGKNTQGIVKELFDAIVDPEDLSILAETARVIQERSAAHQIRFGDTVAELTQDTLDEVVDFISGTPSLKASVDLLSNPDAMVNRLAKTKVRNISHLERKAAQERVQEELGEVISLWDRKGIAAYKKVSEAATKQEASKASLDLMTETARHIDEIPNDPEFVSIADQVVQDVTTTWRRAGLWATDHFAAGHVVDATTGRIRSNQLGRAFQQAHSNNVNFSQSVAKSLNGINRMGTQAEIREAYAHVQRGLAGQVSPKVAQIAEEIHKVNSMFFDTVTREEVTTQGIMPTFLNRGFDLDHIAMKIEKAHYDFSPSEMFDWDAIKSLKTPVERATELQRQWAQMEIKDPVSFMGKMSALLGSVNAEMSMSQNLWLKLTELKGASTAYRPGMVQLKDLASSPITRYFPSESIWVEKDLVPDLQRLNKLLSETMNFGNGGLNKFINGTYAPLLARWKSGVTIWRPGHHVRNLVGDVSLSFLADGVKDPRYYNAAAQMIGHRARYDGIDMLRITQGLDTTQLIGDGKKMRIRLGGGRKPVDITYDEAYDSAMREGILKDFSVQEDLIEASDSPAWIRNLESSALGKPLGGRGKEFVGTISQARDDFVRMAHYLHLLQHPPAGGFKSKEELFSWAAARVDKVHPDGTGLTGFERKLRLLIPFYSWMRKSIPLVLEAAAQNPGRVLVAPKAMYNMAQANGLELESMSDPYPDDQLFPSWIMDSMSGPVYQDSQHRYWSINPGDVSTDTFNMLMGQDLKGELLDMLSPFVKLPIELQTGQTLGKGIKKPDPLEYIGSQIPGISHLQTLTGTDILGSVPSALSGEGLDDTIAVQKGNRGNLDADKLLNFILGMQASNMSTPSIINSAEIEMRNRAREGQ